MDITVYWRELFRFGVRLTNGDTHLAQDLVQTAYERAIPNNAQNMENPRAWLYAVVKNAYVDYLRANPHKVSLDVLLDPESDWREPADPEAWELLSNVKLINAIRELPIEFREVIFYNFLLDYTLDETAKILSIPAGTARSRGQRGLKMLRELMAA